MWVSARQRVAWESNISLSRSLLRTWCWSHHLLVVKMMTSSFFFDEKYAWWWFDDLMMAACAAVHVHLGVKLSFYPLGRWQHNLLEMSMISTFICFAYGDNDIIWWRCWFSWYYDDDHDGRGYVGVKHISLSLLRTWWHHLLAVMMTSLNTLAPSRTWRHCILCIDSPHPKEACMPSYTE